MGFTYKICGSLTFIKTGYAIEKSFKTLRWFEKITFSVYYLGCF